jgi:hypothetical protein
VLYWLHTINEHKNIIHIGAVVLGYVQYRNLNLENMIMVVVKGTSASQLVVHCTFHSLALGHSVTYLCAKQMWPIWSCVTITSSLWMDLKDDYHTCTVSLTSCNLLVHEFVLPGIYSSVEVCVDVDCYCSITHWSSIYTASLAAVSVALLPGRPAWPGTQPNIVVPLTDVTQLADNLSCEWVVSCVRKKIVWH